MKKSFFTRQNKFIFNKNTNKISVRNYTIQELPSLIVGAFGDPHIYVRQARSINPTNYIAGKYLANFGDNKSGSSGNNEILFLHIETTKYKIQIFYTNKNLGAAKGISNVRVVFNGVSTTYTTNAYLILGPVIVSIARVGLGANYYLNLEMKWDKITNILKFAGVMNLIIRKIADNNGYYNGRDGTTWDGITYAGQDYGVTRASFETANIQTLSLDAYSIQTDITIPITDSELDSIPDISVVERTLDQEGKDDNTNQPLATWDSSWHGDPENGIASSKIVYLTHATLENNLANLYSNGTSIQGDMTPSIATSIINNISLEFTPSYSYTMGIPSIDLLNDTIP